MSEIAETQSPAIPKRDDPRQRLPRQELKGLTDKDLADKQTFAQVEKWMATIREHQL